MSGQDTTATGRGAKAQDLWRGLSLTAYLSLVLWWFWGQVINHDSSWFLHATADWLSGARLYQDILEVNPPLIFLHHVPAILLSHALGITPTQAFYSEMLVLIGVSLWWSTRIIARTHANRAAWIFLAGGALLLVFPFGRHIGQREHFLAICLWPYLAAHLARPDADSGAKGALTAAFAAAGLLLKPHFLLIPLGVTLGRMLADKRWSSAMTAGNLVIAAACIGYILLARLLAPAYFGTIIPLAIETYGAYQLAPLRFLLNVMPWLLLPVFAVLLAARSTGLPRGSSSVLLAASGALCVYVAQGNGFDYHAIPLFACLGLFYCWLAAMSADRRLVMLALAAFVLHAQFTFQTRPYRYAMKEVLAGYLAGSQPARSIVVVSADIFPYFPLIDLFGTRWLGSFPVQWPVAGPVLELAQRDCTTDADRCARLRGHISYAVERTARDIVGKRPDLVIFDTNSQFFWPLNPEGAFDLEALYFANPDLAAAMADYRLVGQEENHRFWRRVSAAP